MAKPTLPIDTITVTEILAGGTGKISTTGQGSMAVTVATETENRTKRIVTETGMMADTDIEMIVIAAVIIAPLERNTGIVKRSAASARGGTAMKTWTTDRDMGPKKNMAATTANEMSRTMDPRATRTGTPKVKTDRMHKTNKLQPILSPPPDHYHTHLMIRTTQKRRLKLHLLGRSNGTIG